MRRTIKGALALLFCALLALAGCAPGAEKVDSSTKDARVAGDYYLDLSELGMKLTVYLRLDEAGDFTFSNTLSFETVKSAGTFQASGDGYLMVFTSVNGEEKSISDGLNSGFAVLEDGSLDFGGFGTIPYGSASITTVSEENPSVRLMAMPVTDDFVAPSTDSEFQAGIYAAEDVSAEGVEYGHIVSFFEDNTYLHVIRWEADGRLNFAYETGSYGISTTQLALEPQDGRRVQCEVVDASGLKLSILPRPGAEARETLDFAKKEAAELVASLSGTGGIPGSAVTFDVILALYEDGSYVAVADGYEERGLIAIDTATGYAKQYPDHPSSGVRGMGQVTTVPFAACDYAEDGGLELREIRVCTSENLTRFKATVFESSTEGEN